MPATYQRKNSPSGVAGTLANSTFISGHSSWTSTRRAPTPNWKSKSNPGKKPRSRLRWSNSRPGWLLSAPLSGRLTTGLPGTTSAACAVRLRGKIFCRFASPSIGGLLTCRSCRFDFDHRALAPELVDTVRSRCPPLDVGAQTEVEPASDVVASDTAAALDLVIAATAAEVAGPAATAGL